MRRKTAEMMGKETLHELKIWFSDYVSAFKTGEADFQQNIILKEFHSYRVCHEILYIGESLGLKEEYLRLAESIALLHDIGRFEQYARHQTFADHLSVNHAEFGVAILRENKVLKEIDEAEQDLILRAIAYHNRANLPSDETDRCLFFSKLLRDADKLDIWQVFIDYYAHNNGDRNSAIIHNLPDTPGISDGVYADLKAMRNV
ncbi:MAG: HD domain-containing protein, partial [Chloroflexota bacterium]|nr:HD domain-containing protein [Chloroflexota bacterium]